MKRFNYRSLAILPLLSILAMSPSDIQLKSNYRSIASAIPEVQKETPKPEDKVLTEVFQVEDKKEDIKKDEVVKDESKKEEVKKEEVKKEEKKEEVAKEEPKKEEPNKEEKKEEVAKEESKKEDKKEDKKSDQEKLICDLEEKNKALTKQMEQLMADQKQIMQTMLGMNQMMVSMFQQQQQQNPWQPYMNSLGMQSVYQYAPQMTAGNWVYYPQGFQPSQQNIFAQPQMPMQMQQQQQQPQMPALQGGMYPDQMHMQQSDNWGLRPQMNFDSASFMMQPQPVAGNFGGDAMGFNFGPQAAPTLSYNGLF